MRIVFVSVFFSKFTNFTIKSRVAVFARARITALVIVGACAAIFALIRIQIAWQF